MDIDAPLDFEQEDDLLSLPPVTKRRKKIIGLDDLLTDHFKQKSKQIEIEKKRSKAARNYDSDEDERKEALFSNIVDSCQNQMQEISGDEEVLDWGLHVFGDQKTPPSLDFQQHGRCNILQSFLNNELNSIVDLTTENEETFLEGLLINGWLSRVVIAKGHLEESVASWTLNLMLYSSKEELWASAGDFWCKILTSKDKADVLPMNIECFPTYSQLKKALVVYGFSANFSSNSESTNDKSASRGPPRNLIAWIKLAAACCQARCKNAIFSTIEVEELLEVVLCLFLDRQFLALTALLSECIQSIIKYFTDEEWFSSCQRIAKSLALRVPRDLNCLQIVDSISAVNDRSKQLKSVLAHQILILCFDNKAVGDEDILNFLIDINVRDKTCDLFRMYIYLVLTENWLLSCSNLEEAPIMNEMWGVFLRNCSCQISSTDMRPYASKVRDKASYLLQGPVNI